MPGGRAAFPIPPEVLARARTVAALDIESSAAVLSLVAVITAGIMRSLPHAGPPHTALWDVGVGALAVVGLLRSLHAAWARRRWPDHDPRRARWAIGLFVFGSAIWSALTAVSTALFPGSTLQLFGLLVACLGATFVILLCAPMPRIAASIGAVVLVPPALGCVASGGGALIGGFALAYGALLAAVAPRFLRHQVSGLASVLMLEERARSLEQARDTAVRAAAAKDAFLANLSHEIRTPLHGLLGTAERLRATPLDDAQRVAVEQLASSGRNLLHVLNDALDAVRLEAGQLQLRQEPFSLRALIEEAVGLFRAAAGDKGVALALHLDVAADDDGRGGGAADVVGDPHRLRQVLQNLVGNAVKFTAQGRVDVTARTERAGDGVELSVTVRDTGVGFDARDAARLFQRFGQLGDAPGRGGTGLGLAISRELVELMGGEIDGSSAGLGHGALFRVRVPLQRARPATPAVRGRRVLLVDDNAVNLAVARAYLQALGVDVEEASGGAQALALAGAHRYDAILMDCQMPDVDGIEATRQLRARGDRTPVLAVTATDDATTESRCKGAGMDGLIVKPVSPLALQQALSRVLPAVATVTGATASV